MTTINELLAQARQRLQNATTDEQREAAQAEIDRLEWARQQGFSTGQQMGTERDSGRSAGEESARRAQAERLGVSLDELDAELDRLAEIRREQQSEADRLREQNTTLENERESERTERERAQAELERFRIDEAITRALDGRASREDVEGGNLRPGKRALALRSIDRSAIRRDDQGALTGVAEAVETLFAEEPSWFGEAAPENPRPAPEPRDRTSSGGNLFTKTRKEK